jgi:hypothetical protein
MHEQKSNTPWAIHKTDTILLSRGTINFDRKKRFAEIARRPAMTEKVVSGCTITSGQETGRRPKKGEAGEFNISTNKIKDILYINTLFLSI